MLTSLSGTDLLRACQILFSPEESCSLSFVKSLNPDTLKTAFRKKALETHPDRATAMGVKEQEQSRRFREVKHAYDVLLPLAVRSVTLTNWPGIHPSPRPVRKPAYPKHHVKKTSFYTGCIPTHTLKLGQYLYYSGIITWRHLIDAISWQKQIKPRYGQIAREWNIIDHDQILDILKGREKGERFGEFARRSGYISDFQHLAILGKQNKHHRLFGEYFVQNGILTQRQLDILLKRLTIHNQTSRHAF